VFCIWSNNNFCTIISKTFGTIEVTRLYAAIITGIIGGLAAGSVDYSAKIKFLNY